jgi:uncharacterized protein YchJ
MREYTVYMQWDSYEGSPFVETHTQWYYASSEGEARGKAISEHGNKKGFKINYVD